MFESAKRLQLNAFLLLPPSAQFVCSVPTLRQVREKLDSLGLCSVSAGLEFIPTISTQLSDEEMDQASRLLEALRDNLDVVRVYDNIA